VKQGAAAMLLAGCLALFGQDQETEKAPRQPIAFSHKLHVTGLKQPCKVCHPNADPGEMMGLPEISTCMQCHSKIAPDDAGARKLQAFAKQGRDVDWVRVYQIPTYVSFNHRAHLRAGASCQTCHGAVAERTALAKEKETSMGACINCHLANHASIDCAFCHEPR
jgi:Cytochrome c7 and related cytochrome c